VRKTFIFLLLIFICASSLFPEIHVGVVAGISWMSDSKYKGGFSYSGISEVVVVVKEDYGSEVQQNLPYFEFVSKLLKAGGKMAVRVSGDETVPVLRIEFRAFPIFDLYTSGMLIGLGGGESLYTGASIKGTIVFTAPSGVEIKTEFSGKIEPPKSIQTFSGGKTFRTQEDAPFLAAWEQSSFAHEIGKVIAKAFGGSFLAPLVKDEDVKCRRAAVSGMGAKADPTVVEPLIIALKDKDIEVRRTAIWALGETKDLRAEESLLTNLKDPEGEVRLYAVRSLGNIVGPHSWEPLSVMLQDPNGAVRAAAIYWLGKFNDQRTVEALLPLLKDKIKEVRQAAAENLANIGDSRLLETFIALLKDEDEWTRKYAVDGLRKIKDPKTLEPLVKALEDKNDMVSSAASWALVERGSSSVEPLIAAVQSKVSSVREMEIAARTLGRIKDPRAVDPLIPLLQDFPDVQEAAIKALGQIGDPRAAQPLISLLRHGMGGYRSPRYDVYNALLAIGKPAVEPLISTLKDRDENRRIGAAALLGSLGDPKAIQPLKEALSRETSKEARDAMTFSLAELEKERKD